MGNEPLFFGGDAQLGLRIVVEPCTGVVENLIRRFPRRADQEHVSETILVLGIDLSELGEGSVTALSCSGLFTLRPMFSGIPRGHCALPDSRVPRKRLTPIVRREVSPDAVRRGEELIEVVIRAAGGDTARPGFRPATGQQASLGLQLV